MPKKVAIIMGSPSDKEKIRPAVDTLSALGILYEVHVMSAHRTPAECASFASAARDEGFGVLIGAAGMAAHLAGALAAQTVLPVIGLPLSGGVLDGLDALLATVEMPPGMPVATVAVNGAKNAALLAAQILAVHDGELAGRLMAMRAEQSKAALKADASVGAELNGD